MKGKWISVTLALALVALAFGALPVPQALAAAAITADYYPLNVAYDGTAAGGTPYAAHFNFTGGTANATYYVKGWNFKTGGTSAGYTWNGSAWVSVSDAVTTGLQFTTDGGGNYSGWIFLKTSSTSNSAGTGYDLRVRVYGPAPSTATVATFISGGNVAMMNMTTTGGWLDESNGTARAGRAYVVKSSSTIVGMYVSEDNGVTEGYPTLLAAAAAPAAPMAAGYSRVAVPACATCGYTIESWDLAAPGTAIGQVNTMGSDPCPNSVTAGSTTSLNLCSVPTAVTLRTLTARAPVTPLAALPVAALALAGGLVALRRRKA